MEIDTYITDINMIYEGYTDHNVERQFSHQIYLSCLGIDPGRLGIS